MRLSINGRRTKVIRLKGDEASFNFGYGVFETVRTYKGVLFTVPEHLRRLRRSAKAIGLRVCATDAQLTRWLQRHCTEGADLFIKLIATPEAIYITSRPLIIDPALYNRGVRLRIYRVLRVIPYAKTMARLPEYITQRDAVRHGYHDALLVTENDMVLEAACSNITIVKRNVLITPHRDILFGITRGIVLRLARRFFTVNERHITLRELYNADEIFITRSTVGVVPVVRIDRHHVGDGKPGKVTQQLMALYNAYVQKKPR